MVVIDGEDGPHSSASKSGYYSNWHYVANNCRMGMVFTSIITSIKVENDVQTVA